MSTPPSELRARIGAQVRTSRQRQGLGPHVTDAGLLGKLATRVLEPAEPALEALAHGSPISEGPG